MTKTDNQADVGKHKFELAGLGLAPFRFTRASDNVVTYPDGSSKPGSSCDYCGTSIRTECWVQGADGREFKVGCDCIRKVGDTGLLKAYKSSPEFRAKAAKIREDKARAVFNELNDLIRDNAGTLTDLPHPRGFTDFETGKPLTALDYAIWMKSNCGATGRHGLLKGLKKLLGKS